MASSCRHVVIGYAGSVKLCTHLTMTNMQYDQAADQAPNKLNTVLRSTQTPD